MTLDADINSKNPIFYDGRLRKAQLKMQSMLDLVDSICLKHDIHYWLDAGTLLGAVRHQGFIPWDDDMDIAMPRDSFNKFLEIAPKELPEHIWLQTKHSDPGYYNMAAPLKIRDLKSHYLEKHESGNEPYVQGIFIDVFVYDLLPSNATKRKLYKFLTKKMSRVISTHYSVNHLGHHSKLYQKIGQFLSAEYLENKVQKIIAKNTLSNSLFIGRGYHCVGKNCLLLEDIYPLKRMRFEDKFYNVPNNSHETLWQQFGDYTKLPPPEERVLRHCKELIPEI